MHYIYYIRPHTHLFAGALTYLFTYLHSWLDEYKTGNISETVEDSAKVIIITAYRVSQKTYHPTFVYILAK